MVAEPDPVRKWIVDDLDALLKALPPDLVAPLRQRSDLPELLEVVIDLGRSPEARFPFGSVTLREGEATAADIQYVVSRIGSFGEDNRAGIPRTLHRISCIRNRKGDVIGLTCRVGRAVYGTVKIIEDLVQMGESILFLGKPGVGKTTLLREVARVLADDLHKRVVIVDTSNEIAGDGDIPHPAIGRSRRMQVPTPTLQHAVMIEAVENHMPEVIIVDEMGTELEAAAARTIAERGVQLVATAHGNTLENLIMNPTLSDLVGGIQSVTLGDEEARRRGTQKSILERKAPPTFDILVEIQSWDRLAVHTDVAEVVDSLLRGGVVTPEVRWIDQAGNVRIERPSVASEMAGPRLKGGPRAPSAEARTRIYALGVNRSRIEQTARAGHMPIEMVYDLANADVVMTTKAYYRNRPQVLRTAEASGVPIHVLRKSTPMQIEQSLRGFVKGGERPHDPMGVAVKEVEEAVNRLKAGESKVELSPQSAYIRRIQHQIAEKYRVTTRSVGKEPFRRVTVFSDGGGEVEGET